MDIYGCQNRDSRRKQGKYIQPAVRQEMYGELKKAEAVLAAVTVSARRKIAGLANEMKVYLLFYQETGMEIVRIA